MRRLIYGQYWYYIFTNIDIIFIKHYFSGEESGLYSSASVLAKMILYVSSAVTVALFPMVTEKVSKNQETRGVLKKAFKYGGGLSVATALGLVILRKPMIYILYGSKYMEATRYLIGLSIMVVVLSFASIVINYILALGKIRQLCLGVILGVIISFGLMIIYHRTINQVVLNLVIALSAFLVYMALVIRVEARKSITNVSS